MSNDVWELGTLICQSVCHPCKKLWHDQHFKGWKFRSRSRERSSARQTAADDRSRAQSAGHESDHLPVTLLPMIALGHKVPVTRAIFSPPNCCRWSLIWLPNCCRWAIRWVFPDCKVWINSLQWSLFLYMSGGLGTTNGLFGRFWKTLRIWIIAPKIIFILLRCWQSYLFYNSIDIP